MKLQPKRFLTSALVSLALGVGVFAGASALALTSAATEPEPAYAAQAGIWKKSGNSWWYAYSRGGYATGWQQISGGL